jgi:hypothetical protein
VANIRGSIRTLRARWDDAGMLAGLPAGLPKDGERWLTNYSLFPFEVFWPWRQCADSGGMHHRPVFLVDRLLDHVTPVRPELSNPRDFDCHDVQIWVCDDSKCIVPLCPCYLQQFFAPPFTRAGLGVGAESIDSAISCRPGRALEQAIPVPRGPRTLMGTAFLLGGRSLWNSCT